MSELAGLLMLYGVGVVMLLADIFIPSHGILTVAGLGFLVAGVVQTFSYGGDQAGTIAIFACLVFLPVFGYLAIKYWPMTPIGRRISPPSPVLTTADSGVPIEEMTRLLGQIGRTTTPLRPVGTCDFSGKRVSCIAEFGLVDAGVTVEAVRISGSNLVVQESKA